MDQWNRCNFGLWTRKPAPLQGFLDDIQTLFTVIIVHSYHRSAPKAPKNLNHSYHCSLKSSRQDFSQNANHWNHRSQNNTFTRIFDGLMCTNTVFEHDSTLKTAKFRLAYTIRNDFWKYKLIMVFRALNVVWFSNAAAHFFFVNLLCIQRWGLSLNSSELCNQPYSHVFRLKEYEKTRDEVAWRFFFGKIGSTGDSGLWEVFKTVKSRFTVTVIIDRDLEQNFRFQISEIIDDFSEHCL